MLGEDEEVIEKILKHLDLWDLKPDPPQSEDALPNDLPR